MALGGSKELSNLLSLHNKQIFYAIAFPFPGANYVVIAKATIYLKCHLPRNLLRISRGLHQENKMCKLRTITVGQK